VYAGAQGWAEPGFPLDQPVNLLLMLGGADQTRLQDGIEQIFGAVLAQYPATTGIIATSRRQEADLWRLREDTDQLYRAHAAAPSFDVSVPLSDIGGYVEYVQHGLARIDGGIAPYVFGQLADGNLHIVLDLAGPLKADTSRAVEQVLYAPLRGFGGSFAAEHGIGAKRVAALAATADPQKLALMARVKQALDPLSTLNPGKVLPPQPIASETFP
jgi:FAD/FMN-containing dehydrogenase